jgi:hypothetical protein
MPKKEKIPFQDWKRHYYYMVTNCLNNCKNCCNVEASVSYCNKFQEDIELNYICDKYVDNTPNKKRWG